MQLLIDCSTNFLSVALFNNDNLVDNVSIELQKNLTKVLVITVQNILEKNNINKNNIKEIYVVKGPGSFTSIKLVSIFANTWKSIDNSIALYEINTCLWHATCWNSFIYLNAKSNKWYTLLLTDKIHEIELVSDEKCNELRNYYTNKKFNLKEISDVNNLIEKWKFNKKNFVLVNKVKPLYVKEAI